MTFEIHKLQISQFVLYEYFMEKLVRFQNIISFIYNVKMRINDVKWEFHRHYISLIINKLNLLNNQDIYQSNYAGLHLVLKKII